MTLRDGLQILADVGLFEVIIPFLLVFTITYGILERNQIFGKNKRKIHAMLSFVLGFMAIAATNVLQVINIVTAYFVLGLVVMLLLALIMGLSGAGFSMKNRLLFGISLAFIVVFILYGLASANVIDLERFVNVIFIPALLLGGLALILYFAFAPRKKTKTKKPERPQPQQPAPPQQRISREQLENMKTRIEHDLASGQLSPEQRQEAEALLNQINHDLNT